MREDSTFRKDVGGFTSLDRHFANLMFRLARNRQKDLWLAAAMVSHLTQDGHVCLDLAEATGKSSLGAGNSESEEFLSPDLSKVIQILKESGVTGNPGEFFPLILDSSNRLYLHRYWLYEKNLADSMQNRAVLPAAEPSPARLKEILWRLFPREEGEEINWQRIAAVVSVFRKLSLITGGPGTGKTSAVVKIIALLLELAEGRKLAVAMAAPTGKAAARLKESVKTMLARLDVGDDLRERVPVEAFTLHRLLGTIPSSTHFRHSAENPLPFDVVVVDEASMVDLPLMAKLADALPAQARLILLGDRDQLASVEPGAVFGDLCGPMRSNAYSPDFARLIQETSGDSLPVLTAFEASRPIRDSIVVLEKSHRFGGQSGIGRLSHLIKTGQSEAAVDLLRTGDISDVSWREDVPPSELESELERKVLTEFSLYLKAEDVAGAFASFSSFRILCALREGREGIVSINQMVERILARHRLIRPRGRWYRGQPVLVTRNDYMLKLFNGDVGILLPEPHVSGESTVPLRAFFPSDGGGYRSVLPARLPEHETTFAMTVHKGQGSEFDRVLLIFPSRPSRVLTRELLYTGITRARQHVEIWAPREVLLQTAERRIERRSGLREALWGET